MTRSPATLSPASEVLATVFAVKAVATSEKFVAVTAALVTYIIYIYTYLYIYIYIHIYIEREREI